MDIWYLVKYGIPNDLRVSLWKDLLRRSIHEQFEYAFFKKSYQGQEFNGNISVYENLKMFSNSIDSLFYTQLENDLREFEFPSTYLKNAGSSREERVEEERLSIY